MSPIRNQSNIKCDKCDKFFCLVKNQNCFEEFHNRTEAMPDVTINTRRTSLPGTPKNLLSIRRNSIPTTQDASVSVQTFEIHMVQ
jgi:hypothetical protein